MNVVEGLKLIKKSLERGVSVIKNEYGSVGFNMGTWYPRFNCPDQLGLECDTACCIGGTLEELIKTKPYEALALKGFSLISISRLFYPTIGKPYGEITADEAAIAIGNFLEGAETNNEIWGHV